MLKATDDEVKAIAQGYTDPSDRVEASRVADTFLRIRVKYPPKK